MCLALFIILPLISLTRGLGCWPANPENPPVFIATALELQAQVAMLSLT